MTLWEKSASNTVKCTACKWWIHKRYSGVRGNMSLIVYGFKYKRCDGIILEPDLAKGLVMYGETCGSVKNFCSLGDNLVGNGAPCHVLTLNC